MERYHLFNRTLPIFVGPFGWLSDRIGRRIVILFGGFAYVYGLYLLSNIQRLTVTSDFTTLTEFGELQMIIWVFALAGAMRGGVVPPFEMDLSEGGLLGTKMSVLSLVGVLAASAAVVVGGMFIEELGFRQVLLIAAGIAFVFNLGILFVKPEGGGKE